MPLRILEKSKAMDILVQLLISGKKSLPFMQLIERTEGNISTVSTRIAELESEGLVTQTYAQTDIGRRTITLTPKGYKAALKVFELGRLLEKTRLDFTNGHCDARFWNAVMGRPFIPEEKLNEVKRFKEEQLKEKQHKKQ